MEKVGEEEGVEVEEMVEVCRGVMQGHLDLDKAGGEEGEDKALAQIIQREFEENVSLTRNRWGIGVCVLPVKRPWHQP